MNQDRKESRDRVRVLAIVRWPVGGIRTWCKYIYRSPGFEQYSIDLVIPKGAEAAAAMLDITLGGAVSKVIEVDSSSWAMTAQVAALIRRGRYSLVHSHGFLSAVLGFLPCRLWSIPHLVTVHDVVLDDQYRNWKGRCVRKALNTVLGNVDGVHAVSQTCANYLTAAFPGAKESRLGVRTVMNGIDPKGFLSATRGEIREMLGIASGTILVGFFGRFMAQKGFRYLVEAVRIAKGGGLAAPNVAVLAVGGGGFRKEEEAEIERLGLRPHFHFLDFVPDISGLIKSVDVVVVPSLWEACPLLPMEVLVAGVPLVSSDFPALLEVVEGTPAKTIPMKDAGALLQAIVEMGTAEKRAAAEAFAPQAACRFESTNVRQSIANLYSEVLELT